MLSVVSETRGGGYRRLDRTDIASIWAVLADDPCSLLDEVRDTDCERFHELSRDADHNGAVTEQSRCEARIALTMEYRHLLAGPVRRPPWSDVEDADGQLWDIKSPRSEAAIRADIERRAAASGRPRPPHFKATAAFDLSEMLDRIVQQQRLKRFGVIVDLRRLTPRQAQDLMDGVAEHAEITQALIRYLPDDISPYRESP